MKYLFLISLFVFVGCTMTKRVHQPGYHIEWKKKSIRNIQVVEHTTNSEVHPIAIKSATALESDVTNVSNVSTVSDNDSIMEHAPISQEKVSVQKNSIQKFHSKKIVHEVGKQISTIKSAVKSTNNQYIGASRADLMVRVGLILLLVAAVTIGIGLLFFVFGGEVGWIFGVILTLIGAGALIASLLILLFSLIIFLIFG
jgi:virulence-associated protein VapD